MWNIQPKVFAFFMKDNSDSSALWFTTLSQIFLTEKFFYETFYHFICLFFTGKKILYPLMIIFHFCNRIFFLISYGRSFYLKNCNVCWFITFCSIKNFIFWVLKISYKFYKFYLLYFMFIRNWTIFLQLPVLNLRLWIQFPKLII